MTRSGAGKVYYGWWIVVASIVGISAGPAPIIFSSLGLFFAPFSSEFGWSRTEISLAFTVCIVLTALSLPLIGRIVDRVGSRRVLLPSMIVLGLCVAAIPAFVAELWHLIIVFVIVGTLGAATNTLPYIRTLSVWFDRYRGLAIGISISGIGLGYAYVPLLVRFMIDNFDWRVAYYSLSAIVILLAAPLILAIMRDSPGEMGLRVDGGDAHAEKHLTRPALGVSVSEAFRCREFWMIVATFAAIAFVLHGMLVHLIPMLSDRGVTATSAAAVASLMGIMVFVSRILVGYLVDHFFAPRVALIFIALSTVGIGIYALGYTQPVATYFAAAMIGLSLGAEIDLLGYMTSRYFGLKAFGEIYGFLFAAVLFGTALGPPVFGWQYDSTGSYRNILLTCIGLNAGAFAITAFLGPYPQTYAPRSATLRN